MGKTPCCDKSKVKRGLWSPEEDATLKSYIDKNGTGGNWITLPQKAGLNRCGKSCRLRWLNYLRPDIKHEAFTQEEDNIIYTLYGCLGNKWSIIASYLPGRTDNDVKNHWNTKLRKKLMATTAYTNTMATTAPTGTSTDVIWTSTTYTSVPTFTCPETSPVMPYSTQSTRNPSFSSSSQQDSTISPSFSHFEENFVLSNGSGNQGFPMNNIGCGNFNEILSGIWSQEAVIEAEVPELY